MEQSSPLLLICWITRKLSGEPLFELGIRAQKVFNCLLRSGNNFTRAERIKCQHRQSNQNKCGEHPYNPVVQRRRIANKISDARTDSSVGVVCFVKAYQSSDAFGAIAFLTQVSKQAFRNSGISAFSSKIDVILQGSDR